MGDEDRFKCEACGGGFDADNSTDDALHEFNEKFSTHDPTDVVVLCDDCAEIMYAWISKLSPEEVKRMEREYYDDCMSRRKPDVQS